MPRDFTLRIYRALLGALTHAGYAGVPYQDYASGRVPADRFVILRHDVDRKPRNALRIAEMQHEFGFRGSYYFGALPRSHNEEVILRIADLGHEIGYHYEDLVLARGDVDLALRLFEKHLDRLRALHPVTTMCMHGSPASRFDNRKMWEMLDYRSYGIIGEPYFDVDFDEVFYLTDTGRRWNDRSVSVRDRVSSAFDDIRIGSTQDLISKIERGELPDRIMMNVHPQRWDDALLPWTKELVFQSAKNIAKKWIYVRRVGAGSGPSRKIFSESDAVREEV